MKKKKKNIEEQSIGVSNLITENTDTEEINLETVYTENVEVDDTSSIAEYVGNNSENQPSMMDENGPPKVIRAKNSHLPVKEKQRRSIFSILLPLILIAVLIGLLIYGSKHINDNSDKNSTGTEDSTEVIEVNDVMINISGGGSYEVAEDGSIVAGNSRYTPKYDDEGNVVAYVDQNGVVYEVYEVPDTTGVVIKYIDIKINIKNTTIEMPTIGNSTIEIPTIGDSKIEIPTINIP